jgi:hypothetical protein
VKRGVVGSKGDEVKLDWRNLWCSPNVIRVRKSSVKWRDNGHVWGTTAYRNLVGG